MPAVSPSKGFSGKLFPCTYCNGFFTRVGLIQHRNACHRTDARPPPRDSSFKKVYHPELNGMVASIYKEYGTLTHLLAVPCNINGDFLPPNTPPPPTVQPPPTNLSPFESRVEFELAELLFTQTEMSNTQFNNLMELWAADAARDGREPPFGGSREFWAIIDSIEGGVEWKRFEVKYSGELPNGPVPNWMTQPLEVFYRDPKTVLHKILKNRTFDDKFTYTPYREYKNMKRHWSEFMSGNWAWDQAVCTHKIFSLLSLTWG